MDQFSLRDINICHAHLNALHAALKGKESCMETLSALGLLSDTARKLSNSTKHLEFIEALLEELWEGDTLSFDGDIHDLPEVSQRVIELLHNIQNELEANASITTSLLATKDFKNDLEAIGRLTALFACQVQARMVYIQGLVKYGAIFDAPHLEERWQKQLESSRHLIERKQRFIEAAQNDSFDPGLLNELINETLLLPSSFLCQVHDVNQILSLSEDEFSYESAEFSQAEARLWQECGIPADRAGYWRAYGIGPDEVFEWLDCGFAEPRDAGTWKVRNYSPKNAELWSEAGYDAEQAQMYISSGYAHPDFALALNKWEH